MVEPVRVCLVYDCLFPHTVGGAERWYRNLAERLSRGRPRGDLPDAAPVAARRRSRRAGRARRRGRAAARPLHALGPAADRPAARVRRSACSRTWPGAAAATTSSTPPRSPTSRLLAAGSLRRRRGYRLVVDWHELWTREYWRDYLGRAGGWVGWRVQRACARIPQRAFCFSRLHAARLRARGRARRGDGAARASTRRDADAQVEPYVDSEPWSSSPAATSRRSGCRRWCPRSRSRAVRARAARRDLRRRARARARARAGARARARGRGRGARASSTTRGVDAALRRALCLVLPSRREGYGLVVVEACAAGHARASSSPTPTTRRPS